MHHLAIFRGRGEISLKLGEVGGSGFERIVIRRFLRPGSGEIGISCDCGHFGFLSP